MSDLTEIAEDVAPVRPGTDGASMDGGPVLRVVPEREVPVEGPAEEGPTRGRVAAPRLSRHLYEMADGHQLGVAVSGKGVPFVIVHGFTAEGFLYAQTLSRLVGMGFKVIAIDTANHGSTQGLPAGGANFESYTRLLGRALDELGIRRAFLAGHSMGGRIVSQLAAADPRRAIGVVLIDAIVGDVWDRMVNAFRLAPPLAGGVVALLAADGLTTVPLLRDPSQARKLISLALPTFVGHARRPWRLAGPAISIMRSRGSRWMLQGLRRHGVPVAVVHGDRDYAVPFATARSAAQRAGGELVRVRGGSHAWILKDPETFPAIMAELLQGPFGDAYRGAIVDAGGDPDEFTLDELEALFYEPDAPIRELTPPLEFAEVAKRRRRPRFRFEREQMD